DPRASRAAAGAHHLLAFALFCRAGRDAGLARHSGLGRHAGLGRTHGADARPSLDSRGRRHAGVRLGRAYAEADLRPGEARSAPTPAPTGTPAPTRSRVGSRGIAGCAGAAPCGPIRVARIRIARIAVAGREAGLAGSEPEARILKAGIHADGTGGEPPFTQARFPEPDAGPGPQVLPGPDAGFGRQALLGAQMRPADVLLARADVLLGRKLALRELLAGHFAAPHALARGRMSLRHLGAGAGCLGMGSGLRIGAGCRSFLSRPRG